jgi:hypoxanthine phosphoribosyltransferase
MTREIEDHGHEHSGVLYIGWGDVMRLCRHLAEEAEENFHPDVIIGIAKGGAIPGAILASMLRRDYFPVRITRREADVVIRKSPALVAHIPSEVVRGRKVLVVDEIVVTGDTLRVAVDECWAQGATDVKTAALYVHGTNTTPDWFGLETENLVIQPWDALVYAGGRWQLNQEYRQELERMGLTPSDALTAVLTE